MPSGDRQQPIPVKKVALTELSSKMTNIMPQSHGNSPISKDQGRNMDFPNMLGTKRQLPTSEGPVSQHRLGNPSANGHLVYVRRKLDHEVAVKTCSFDNAGTVGSPESKNDVSHLIKDPSHLIKDPNVRQEQIQEPKHSPFTKSMSVPVSPKSTPSERPLLAHDLKKPNNRFVMPEPNDYVITTTSPLSATQQPSNPHWKERFIRLQMFLKHCDQSSQEEYMRMLRSLPAVGRSEHAVELEKRAIQLMLEEAKELHRMRVLNVLGTSSPNDGLSYASPVTRILHQDHEKAVEAIKFPPLS